MTNYRPISILPIFSKIIERIVHQQLSDYLESNKRLSNYQFGFRKTRNTKQAFTLLTDHIRSQLDSGESTGAVFLDLSKAFDTVDHGCLINKLSCYGIKNLELKWFESYLFGRKQFVEYDGVTTDYKSISTGVPQGSILGPLLFIILINDITSMVEKVDILLYADDTVIFTSHKSAKTIEDYLNSDLEKIATWFNQNNLVINLKKGKTEFMMFENRRKKASFHTFIEILKTPVNETDSYDYLGITLDKRLTMSLQMDKIFRRISSRVNLLKKVRQDVSLHVADTIYKMMISPLMTYCGSLYLENSLTRLKLLQDKARNIVFNKADSCSWRNNLKRIEKAMCT